eukprot:Nk52_evm4s334 gene=Nk52_evmTU4s334
MFVDSMEVKKAKSCEVLVVGNGPAGIMLSYLMSGNEPFVSDNEHPNPLLEARLCALEERSLLKANLCALSDSLEGRSKNAVALLFDNLFHPNADIDPTEPSKLHWEKCKEEDAISHLVVGKSDVGGSWSHMNDMKCLSCGSWMELPGWSVSEWAEESLGISDYDSSKRAKRSMIGAYYRDYVQHMDLRDNFVCGVEIVSAKLACELSDSLYANLNVQKRKWFALGKSLDGDFIPFFSDNVVLAVGVDIPRSLGIGDAEGYRFVKHGLQNISGEYEKEKLPVIVNGNSTMMDDEFGEHFESARVVPKCCTENGLCELKEKIPYTMVVIGGGLSAVDAVLLGLSKGCRVVHAFIEDIYKPSYILNTLPKNEYPEYNKVRTLMYSQESHWANFEGKGSNESFAKEGGYISLPGYRLTTVGKTGECGFVLDKGLTVADKFVECLTGGTRQEKVSVDAAEVLILIGNLPNISFMDRRFLKTLLNKKYPFIDEVLARCDDFKARRGSVGDPKEKDEELKAADPGGIRESPICAKYCSHETGVAEGLYAVGPLVGDDFVRFALGGCLGVVNGLNKKRSQISN